MLEFKIMGFLFNELPEHIQKIIYNNTVGSNDNISFLEFKQLENNNYETYYSEYGNYIGYDKRGCKK